MAVQQISVVDLHNKMQQNDLFLLLDVREPHEFAYAQIAGSTLIPLQQLPSRAAEIDKEREVVVLCHHGMRSRQAAEYLVRIGVKRVLNLSGGIDAWSIECDNGVPRY